MARAHGGACSGRGSHGAGGGSGRGGGTGGVCWAWQRGRAAAGRGGGQAGGAARRPAAAGACGRRPAQQVHGEPRTLPRPDRGGLSGRPAGPAAVGGRRGGAGASRERVHAAPRRRQRCPQHAACRHGGDGGGAALPGACRGGAAALARAGGRGDWARFACLPVQLLLRGAAERKLPCCHCCCHCRSCHRLPAPASLDPARHTSWSPARPQAAELSSWHTQGQLGDLAALRLWQNGAFSPRRRHPVLVPPSPARQGRQPVGHGTGSADEASGSAEEDSSEDSSASDESSGSGSGSEGTAVPQVGQQHRVLASCTAPASQCVHCAPGYRWQLAAT